MLVVAHAGHWLVQLIYVVPLIAVLLAAGYGTLRDRRRARQGDEREPGGRT